METNKLEESDSKGLSYLVIDTEIDKIISSIEKISLELKKLRESDSTAITLEDILETGIAPYVADFTEILNDMEVE